eukprot:4963073-Amphidinium_carterae.1
MPAKKRASSLFGEGSLQSGGSAGGKKRQVHAVPAAAADNPQPGRCLCGLCGKSPEENGQM